MSNWFEVKVAYEKRSENDSQKRVVEAYLVDALTHAEAEGRATAELHPYVKDITVKSVRKISISEMFISEYGYRWFRGRLNFEILDEVSGSSKNKPIVVYVKSQDIKEAIAVIEEGVKGSLATYDISRVEAVNIEDVFVYGKN